jgi:hypothetical protein
MYYVYTFLWHPCIFDRQATSLIKHSAKPAHHLCCLSSDTFHESPQYTEVRRLTALFSLGLLDVLFGLENMAVSSRGLWRSSSPTAIARSC